MPLKTHTCVCRQKEIRKADRDSPERLVIPLTGCRGRPSRWLAGPSVGIPGEKRGAILHFFRKRLSLSTERCERCYLRRPATGTGCSTKRCPRTLLAGGRFGVLSSSMATALRNPRQHVGRRRLALRRCVPGRAQVPHAAVTGRCRSASWLRGVSGAVHDGL